MKSLKNVSAILIDLSKNIKLPARNLMKRCRSIYAHLNCIVLLYIAITFMSFVSGAQARQVVVYTALDQPFSEPILQDFEKTTKIKVRAVYDIEATKTTGLVNRLIAEKRNPQCDVFWNNEIINTIMLKRKGVLAQYVSPSARDIPAQFKDKNGYWAGFAARARVLVVNMEMLSAPDHPRSILDFTDSAWEGKAAIANPLFGTTATHLAALFSFMGQQKAKQYLLNLKANSIRIVDGNSVVRDQVGSGELPAGFTDTDDVNTGILSDMPIQAVYPDQAGFGTLVIPNTVGLIANCPHPAEGKILIDYLLSKQVESRLAFSPSVQMPVRIGVKAPPAVKRIGEVKAMPVDYEQVADQMETTVKFVQEVFIR
jgi:iron(III) transport system substrate-binding protein